MLPPSSLASVIARPAPLALETRGVAQGSLDALGRLLDALGIEPSRLRAGPRPGRGLALASPVGTPLLRDQRRWAVRGLRGVVAGTAPELDVLIVATSRTRPPVEVLSSAVELATGPAGRRLHIVAEAGDRAAARTLERTARNAGVAEVSRSDVAATLAGLVERPRDFDVLFVTTAGGRELAATAGALAGTRALTPRLAAAGDRLLASTADGGPSALVRATAMLLEGLGFRDAPRRLLDAWLLALEDGLEHASLAHLAPYSRRVDEVEFLDGVRERLGRSPRQLAPAADRSGRTRGRPQLRIV